MTKYFCPQCGTKLGPHAKFCPHCGYRLTVDGKTGSTRPHWYWYVGIILTFIGIAIAIYYINDINQNYVTLINHHHLSDQFVDGEVGSTIADTLISQSSWCFVVLAVLVIILALLVIRRFAKINKQLRWSIITILALAIALIGMLNYRAHDGYAMTSNQLGTNYTKQFLTGQIFCYNYLADKKNGRDSDRYADQFGGTSTNNYSHVYLKFNADGTLGVNIDPYWVNDDQTAYQNAQNDNYRVRGSWSINPQGKVIIQWDSTDTRAYKTVRYRVGRRHHHHYVYKTESRYTDAAGDPDTSLPKYFPGETASGNIQFGNGIFKLGGITMAKPNDQGSANTLLK